MTERGREGGLHAHRRCPLQDVVGALLLLRRRCRSAAAWRRRRSLIDKGGSRRQWHLPPTAPAVPDAPIQEPSRPCGDYLARLRRSLAARGDRGDEGGCNRHRRRAPTPLQVFNPMRTSRWPAFLRWRSTSPARTARLAACPASTCSDDGNLLAVSDTGAFVWIDVAEDGVTPSAARLLGDARRQGPRLRRQDQRRC